MIKFGGSDAYQTRFKERLATIRQWCHEDKGLWDLLTCTRGPDSPSERGDGSGAENQSAYKARRERKYRTGEVIRGVSGLNAGAARNRVDEKVILPPRDEWDHYDRHVAKAVDALRAAGFSIRIEIEKKKDAKRDERGRYPVGVVIADPDGYKPEQEGLAGKPGPWKSAAAQIKPSNVVPPPITYVQVGAGIYTKVGPTVGSVMASLTTTANSGEDQTAQEDYVGYALNLIHSGNVIYKSTEIPISLGQNKFVYAPNALKWDIQHPLQQAAASNG